MQSNDEFIFNSNDACIMLQVSAEALRSRRRRGLLDGYYKVINGKVFYKDLRPFIVSRTRSKPLVRKRRRGVTEKNIPTNYPNYAFKKHNDMKMLAKLQKSVPKDVQELIPEAVELAKGLKQERIQKKLAQTSVKNYGYMFNCNEPRARPRVSWRTEETTIFPEPKNEYDQYLEDNNLTKTPNKNYY